MVDFVVVEVGLVDGYYGVGSAQHIVDASLDWGWGDLAVGGAVLLAALRNGVVVVVGNEQFFEIVEPESFPLQRLVQGSAVAFLLPESSAGLTVLLFQELVLSVVFSQNVVELFALQLLKGLHAQL